MMKRLAIAFSLLLAFGARAAENVDAVLQKQTQELLDAITFGKPQVWEQYLDDAAIFCAEDGSVSTKAEMVKQIHPLPEGVSGIIKVTQFKSAVHGNVAISTYVADEHETYHGHQLHCQYRTTDTWQKGAKGWRMIGSQTLALLEDPPPMSGVATDAYVGKYSLAPDITYEIRKNGDKLEGQRNGRKAEPLLVESPDVLFTPGQPRYRKIFQRDAQGAITGFAERREAWDLVWARVP